ncbi:MAG: prolipoprotein diacylglyceryl transferase family protein, partial [Patescibacteria group bacterium]
MIPFFQLNYFQVGIFTIQVWGLFVAGGIIAGTFLMTRLARKYVLSEDVLLDAAIYILISAFFFARVFHVVFYNLEYYVQYPSEIVKFWHGGLSSTGGFFGALCALYLFVRIRRFSAKEFLPYLDIMGVSLWLGFGIGRWG